jgi:hypothetical protein
MAGAPQAELVAWALHARAQDLLAEADAADRDGPAPGRPAPAVTRFLAGEFAQLAAGITSRIGTDADLLRQRP